MKSQQPTTMTTTPENATAKNSKYRLFYDENEKVTNTWECIARGHTHEPIFIFFSPQSWRQVDHTCSRCTMGQQQNKQKRRKTKSISREMCTVLFKENLIWVFFGPVRDFLVNKTLTTILCHQFTRCHHNPFDHHHHHLTIIKYVLHRVDARAHACTHKPYFDIDNDLTTCSGSGSLHMRWCTDL